MGGYWRKEHFPLDAFLSDILSPVFAHCLKRRVLWSMRLSVAGWTIATHFLPTSISAFSLYRMRQLVWSPALVVVTASSRSSRHFIGFQFVSE